MEQKLKNRRVVSRLSRYKNTLYRLKDLGFTKIYSDFLAEEVGVTSSQVRKDFSIFGITGNKRAGYKIDELLSELEKLFHKDSVQEVIIVGAGRLGSAFANYNGFVREQIKVVAAFDIDPSKQNKSGNVPIYPINDMVDYIKENKIEMAILAVPAQVAEDIYKKLIDAGIRGVLNFAPIPLKSNDKCIVTTFCIEVEMDNLIYFVKERKNNES